MVDQRDVLAREVDEELRREQLLKLWEKFGTYIIAVAALIIVGVGGVKYYQHRSAVAAEAAGERFAAATHRAAEVAKTDEIRKELEAIAASGPAGYAVLARLRLAAANARTGKTIEAVADLEGLANDTRVDPLLRDYAQLQAAMLRLDTANWTDMQNRLNDLTTEQNAWRHSARELLGLAAYKAGKIEEARAEFQRLITDRSTPQGVAERARTMMSVIVQAELAKAVPVEPEKPAEPPGKAEIKGKTKAPDGKKTK